MAYFDPAGRAISNGYPTAASSASLLHDSAWFSRKSLGCIPNLAAWIPFPPIPALWNSRWTGSGYLRVGWDRILHYSSPFRQCVSLLGRPPANDFGLPGSATCGHGCQGGGVGIGRFAGSFKSDRTIWKVVQTTKPDPIVQMINRTGKLTSVNYIEDYLILLYQPPRRDCAAEAKATSERTFSCLVPCPMRLYSTLLPGRQGIFKRAPQHQGDRDDRNTRLAHRRGSRSPHLPRCPGAWRRSAGGIADRNRVRTCGKRACPGGCRAVGAKQGSARRQTDDSGNQQCRRSS